MEKPLRGRTNQGTLMEISCNQSTVPSSRIYPYLSTSFRGRRLQHIMPHDGTARAFPRMHMPLLFLQSKAVHIAQRGPALPTYVPGARALVHHCISTSQFYGLRIRTLSREHSASVVVAHGRCSLATPWKFNCLLQADSGAGTRCYKARFAIMQTLRVTRRKLRVCVGFQRRGV